MSATNEKPEKPVPKNMWEIEAAFSERLQGWWNEDADFAAPFVRELLTDLGYKPQHRGLMRSDPIAYRLHQTKYMRTYQARRRKEAKEAAEAMEKGAGR